MKYPLKGVMASTEKDSVNLGYPTLGGGQEVRKSYYKLERFRKGDDDKDLSVKGKNIYFRIICKNIK